MDQKKLESTVFERLAHPDRREILRIITLTDSNTYTDILSKTGLSTGRLNYHLKYLTGFIEKDPQSHYVLTPLGHIASNLLQTMNRQPINGLTDYLQISAPITRFSWRWYVNMPFTISKASRSKITLFSVLMGVVSFIINTTASPYLFPFGTTFGQIPEFIAAITMGPIWGAIAGVIGALGRVVTYFPVGETFMISMIPNLMITGAIPPLLIGFLALKLRPFWAMTIPTAIFSGTLLVQLLLLTLITLNISPVPNYDFIFFTTLFFVGTHIITILVTWICVYYNQINQYFPGYARPQYGTLMKIDKAQED